MSEKEEIKPELENEELENATAQEKEPEAEQPELTAEEKMAKEIDELKLQLEKVKKEYLFLAAEFDNYKKRTLKEKAELIKTAAESSMKGILPVVDDFERALQAMRDSEDVASVREGVDLIYNKFVKYLEQNGVKAIDSTNADFNTEYHEAVSIFPAPEESMKGKVIETVEKGYTLNYKVIRHSKVVVGQ